jgi:hypothetical protein
MEATPLGPNEILMYVQGRLGDVDGQIQDLLDQVKDKNQLSEDLRTFQEAVKGLDRNGTGYDSTGDDRAQLDADAVRCLVAAQDKIQDPALKAQITQLSNDVADDGVVSHDVLTDNMENAKNTLTTINSDNEIIMMRLQSLIQVRTQIVQLCSNALASFNEGAKTTIGNMRG